MTATTDLPFRRRFRVSGFTVLLVFLTLVCGSCSPAPDPTESGAVPASSVTVSAVKEPAVEAPKGVLPDGFEVTLELAITPDELAQGLMFRPHLSENRGMLLIFPEERFPNIWMMNTLVALDIIYLDRSGTVVDVVRDAQPCPGEPCPRFSPEQASQAVLEIPAGGAQRHGVELGSVLDFSGVPGFPVVD